MEKEFDLGILSVFDPTPIETDKLAETAQQNMIEMYQKLWQIRQTNEFKRNEKAEELQQHDFDRGIYEIDLPEKNFIFPRCKLLPKVKPLTRWQKFAKDKKIKSSKNRSKMVYDENSDKWAPRWGAHSIKKNEQKMDWLREVKKGEDIYEDPFHKDALKKKLHKEQLKLANVRNKLNAQGLNGREVINQHNTENQKKRNLKTKQIKQKTKKTLSVAQNSTASMGNFDSKAHKDEQKQKVKKRKQIPSFKSAKEEKGRNLDMLQFIQGQKKVKQ